MLVIKNRNKIWILQTLLLLVTSVCMHATTHAAYLSHRTVFTKTPIAGAVTDYTISFTINTPAMLGSIQMQFCANSPLFDDSCIAPAGFHINDATLSAQSGEMGFSIDPSSTANNLILTRIPSVSFAIPSSYDFSGVTNPTTQNSTTYVRIETYSSTDATGARTDQGAAAFSTSGKFGTNAYIPPLLYFCVGVTVAPDCSSSTGSHVSFGDLMPANVSSVTTEFAAATNDPTGYVVYIYGTTMTSGNNIIPQMPIQNPSLAGTSQFGLNLRANNNPVKGNDVSGSGSGTVKPNYDTPNLYRFNSGDAVAETTSASDYNVYTSTYVTNVSIDQPVGVYVSTLTYTAVAQF